MTTKRVNILAGAILGAVLILGTAGLVLATDPTSSPTASPTSGMPGGMMGGEGMMGGQGMMGGMEAGSMPDMTAMHQAMGEDGTCDPAVMQSMHEQYHSTR